MLLKSEVSEGISMSRVTVKKQVITIETIITGPSGEYKVCEHRTHGKMWWTIYVNGHKINIRYRTLAGVQRRVAR